MSGNTQSTGHNLLTPLSISEKRKEWFIMRLIKTVLTVLLSMLLLFAPAQIPMAYASEMTMEQARQTALRFQDVHEDSWFLNDVIIMLASGTMNGRTATIFAPNDYVTNAEFAQMLYNMDTRRNQGSPVYTDVPSNAWYYNAVQECGEYFPVHWNKYAGAASFFPANPLSRAEFCYTVLRAGGMSDDDIIQNYETFHGSFNNGWVHYPEAAFQLMVDTGYIQGYGNGEYGVYDKLTRAQCAALLVRMALKDNSDSSGTSAPQAVSLDGYTGDWAFDVWPDSGLSIEQHGDTYYASLTIVQGQGIRFNGTLEPVPLHISGQDYVSNAFDTMQGTTAVLRIRPSGNKLIVSCTENGESSFSITFADQTCSR